MSCSDVMSLQNAQALVDTTVTTNAMEEGVAAAVEDDDTDADKKKCYKIIE